MVKKKGFTLIEIVVVLAIMGIGFLVVNNVFSLVINTNKIANNEFDLQSNMRIVSENLNQKIRFSPAVFTLKKETFEKPKKSGWRYFGIEDVKDSSGNITGKQVVEYIPVIEKEDKIDGETVITYKSTGTSADHNRKVLINNINDVDINLYFDKNMSDKNSKLLDFVIEGVTKDSLRRKMTISTKLQALNAMVVEHEGNPAVAIAYRDEVPGKRVKGTQEAYAIITLTLDISGSMSYNLNGHRPTPTNPSRIKILNEKTNKLIADLKSAGDKIYIRIIPYDTRVDGYDKSLPEFQNIKGVNFRNLSAGGGTNTGEALLKAYEMLSNKSPNIPTGSKVNYYNILLTDGEPQTYTYYKSKKLKIAFKPSDEMKKDLVEGAGTFHYYFYRDTWNLRNTWDLDNKRRTDSGNVNRSMKYVKRIAKDYISKSPLEIKSYIIGFGAGNDKLSKEIASYCVGHDSMVNAPVNKDGKSAYYSAKSSEQLDIVYSELTEIIKGDMWHVMGPYNN
ncbi:prepilin-type N-terminal cleavage/methylation domain-containing protein [Peptoanaerobacter stomatis]|uniref:prepilin-type N-terminal cleavage/methylation domain-containing protein n=1 Tax=Peptoanaerobacter stomatis TaxID=796937 RepID=UPI003FA11C1F